MVCSRRGGRDREHRAACRTHGKPQHAIFKGMHTGCAPRHGGLHQGTDYRGKEREDRKPRHLQRGNLLQACRNRQGFHTGRKYLEMHTAMPTDRTTATNQHAGRNKVSRIRRIHQWRNENRKCKVLKNLTHNENKHLENYPADCRQYPHCHSYHTRSDELQPYIIRN